MLVISRKINETVAITCPDGTEIEITVCRLDLGRVGLAFAAPRNYRISRKIRGSRRTIGPDGRDHTSNETALQGETK